MNHLVLDLRAFGLALVTMAAVPVRVSEEMQQRARNQEDIGNNRQYVTGVGDQEVHTQS